MSRRPLIAIPARFSSSAAALRFGADVTARALVDAVYAAGGEPLVVHPVAAGARIDVAAVAERLWFADGVLLPGGGDLASRWSGQDDHETLYDVDEEQDAFDLATAQWALAAGVPLFAVCRGWHVANVALGGDLEQHMAQPHRQVVHDVAVEPGSVLAQAVGTSVAASCFHHQRVSRLGEGLEPVARAADGTVEAAELRGSRGWFLGVQWHPEDTVASDPAQLALFEALVAAARVAAAR